MIPVSSDAAMEQPSAPRTGALGRERVATPLSHPAVLPRLCVFAKNY